MSDHPDLVWHYGGDGFVGRLDDALTKAKLILRWVSKYRLPLSLSHSKTFLASSMPTRAIPKSMTVSPISLRVSVASLAFSWIASELLPRYVSSVCGGFSPSQQKWPVLHHAGSPIVSEPMVYPHQADKMSGTLLPRRARRGSSPSAPSPPKAHESNAQLH